MHIIGLLAVVTSLFTTPYKGPGPNEIKMPSSAGCRLII